MVRKFLAGSAIAAMLAFATALPAAAQTYTEEHLKLARETMLATRSTQFFDGILPTMAEEVRNTFIRIDPSLTTLIEEKTLEAAIELTDRRKQLNDRLAEMWASEFSVEELQVIRDFLTSATGQKFVRISAEFTERQSEIASEWTSELSGDFVSLVRRKLREAGHQL